MGTEAIWVPLVMAAVGTAASVYNTRQTNKRMDKSLARQIDNQASKRAEANKRTDKLLEEVQQSNPAAERQRALSGFLSQLKAGSGAATAGLADNSGSASSRFAADSAAAALGIENYGNQRAEIQASIDAPKYQRDRESVMANRAQTDLQEIDRQARARAFLDGLRVQRAGVRNPYIDAFASAMQSGASAYGSSAGGTGTSGFDFGYSGTPIWGGGVLGAHGDRGQNTAGTVQVIDDVRALADGVVIQIVDRVSKAANVGQLDLEVLGNLAHGLGDLIRHRVEGGCHL